MFLINSLLFSLARWLFSLFNMELEQLSLATEDQDDIPVYCSESDTETGEPSIKRGVKVKTGCLYPDMKMFKMQKKQ